MDKDLILSLFLAASHDSGLPPRELRPKTDYEYLQETADADAAVETFAEHLGIEGRLALPNVVAKATLTYEQQGFLNGFRYGVRLAKLLEALSPQRERERERE